MLADPAQPRWTRHARAFRSAAKRGPTCVLAQRLGVKVGDRIVGRRIHAHASTAIVQQEPEVAGVVFALGPKLLLNVDDVPATNLLQPGNRAT